jgi:hypothetical protein
MVGGNSKKTCGQQHLGTEAMQNVFENFLDQNEKVVGAIQN